MDQFGVGRVMSKTAEFGWIFRVQPGPDFGIDAQIELPDEDGYPTNRLIGLQIKSGPSHLVPTDGGFRFYASEKKVNYWINGNLPVIVVLYDPDADTAYW